MMKNFTFLCSLLLTVFMVHPNQASTDPALDFISKHAMFSVSSLNDSDDSEALGKMPKKMAPCDPVSDFFEDFDSSGNGSVPECWNTLLINSVRPITTLDVRSNATAPSAPNVFRFRNNVANPADFYLVSPAVNNLSDATHRLRFMARGSEAATMSIGTMTDPDDETTFTPLETFGMISRVEYHEYIVDFDQSYSGSHLAFKVNFGTANTITSLFMDNISWEPIPACLKPADLSVSEVSNKTAKVTWAPGNSNENEWLVKYSDTLGFDPETEGTSIEVSNTPEITLGTLTANTPYEVYVQAQCGTDGSSAFIGPFEFHTLCAPSLPFNEGFEEGYASGAFLEGCWTQESVAGNSQWRSEYQSSNAFSGVWAANLSYDNEAWIFHSFELTAGTTYQLSFYAKKDNIGSGSGSVAKVMASFGTGDSAVEMTEEVIPSTEITADGYQDLVGSFTPDHDGIYYLGIKGELNAVEHHIFIDEISLDTPTCFRPTEVTVDAVSSESATISWNPGADETNWVVTYSDIEEFDPQTQGTSVEVSGSPNVVLSGLDIHKTYEVYVQAACDGSAGNSVWVGPKRFWTECEAIGSFTENFDTTSVGMVPNCWRVVGSDSPISNHTEVRAHPNAPSRPHVFSYYSRHDSYMDGAAKTLISPKVNNLADGDHQLRFTFQSPVYEPEGANFTRLIVGTLKGTGYMTEFTPIETINSPTEFTEYIVKFDQSYDDDYIAIRASSNFEGRDYFYYIYLDDVHWEPISACSKPQALQVDGVSAVTADISWTSNGDETEWLVMYGETGMDVSDSSTFQTQTVTATPQTMLQDLDPNTDYEVYVQAQCGGSDGNSVVAGPMAFLTSKDNDNLCDAIPLIVDEASDNDDFSIIDATVQAEEPMGSCWNITNNLQTVWFRFVAPEGGQVTIDFISGTLDTFKMAVYEAPSNCNDLSTLGTQLLCDAENEGVEYRPAALNGLDGLTPGATYFIQVAANGSASGTFGMEVNSSSLSVTDAEMADGVYLYPNPVRSGSVFYLNPGPFKTQEVQMIISDMLGKTVYSSTKQFEASKEAIHLNGPLESGVYFIQLHQNGRTVNKRLLVE